MSVQQSVEIERKYQVGADAPTPEFTALPGVRRAVSGPPVQLAATYFDTTDRRLLAARIALRRRSGGADEGWHLKLAQPTGRLELHAPLGATAPSREAGAPANVPQELFAFIATRVRLDPIVPLAHLDTVRSATVLYDESGEARVEFVDDGVRATDVAAGVVRRWREWEAEQIGDDPAASAALLDAIEPALLAIGARRSASPAKIAQALGLVGRTPFVPAAPATAGEVLDTVVARLTGALHHDVVAVHLGGEEEVHEMRRNLRRLRSVLALTSVAGAGAADIRAAIRPVADLLGASRDRSVAAATAEALLADEPDAPDLAHASARLVAAERTAAEEARALAASAIEGADHAALFAALDAFRSSGPAALEPWDRVFPALVHAAAVRAVRRLERADRSPEDAHRARRAVRRVRLLTEELADRLPASTEALRTRAKALTTVQGDRRDLAILEARLPLLAALATAAGENAFVYGVLASRARAVLGDETDLRRAVRRFAHRA